MGDRQQGEKGREQDQSKQRRNPSAIEWLVGAFATIVVLSGIGFLVYQAWSGTSLPPMLSVEARHILPQPEGGYVVEIVAANRGGTSARDLVVEGRLLEPANQEGGQSSSNQQAGSREVERATTTLTWVPAHAEREGGLLFSHDPRRYRLEVAPKGYDLP